MDNHSFITSDVCTMAILIEGKVIPSEFHVLSVAVTRELNRIPTATIQLQDGEASKSTFEASNTHHFVPGKKIEIQLGYRSQNNSVFKGIIIKNSIKIRKNISLLIIECRDEAIKMTKGNKSRYFINKKDSDIIEEIIELHQLPKEVETTNPTLKEVVQYDATDWDFLLCRAEANGKVVIVNDGKVTVASPAINNQESVFTLLYGDTLLELDTEVDARWQSKGIKASSWNASEQELIEVEAKEPSTLNSGNLSYAELANVIGGDFQEIKHGGRLSTPELQAWADSRLLKERLAKIRGRAKFQGIAGLLPNIIITIAGIGERFEGKMYISGIQHTVANGNWETDVQFGLDSKIFAQNYNLHPLPAGGLLPAVSGLQIGIVTLLENDPDGEDRIKIRLPLISRAEEGIWVRLATLDAGKERGTFFRPEIGDEVVVGFLNADPRYPIILGMCHSSAKPAPEVAKNTNHRKGYVSREKMKFSFDDEKKIIILETPTGNKVILSEEDMGIIIEDQNGNKMIFNNNGIQIESIQDLTLKANKNIKIEGMNIDTKAQVELKAAGIAKTEISGASTTIKGSATTVIQGGVVQIN